MKTLDLKFARMVATTLIGAALLVPLAATAGPDSKMADPKSGKTVAYNPPSAPEQIITAKAVALGAAFTGPALGGLEIVPHGHRVPYQNCDIYYSPATGAHEVHGAIREKYNYLCGPSGGFGLPSSDEMATPSGGRANHFFFHGLVSTIVWSPDTGAMGLRGVPHGAWLDQGWELGPLGYPTSDERLVGPDQWYTDFQNGGIYREGEVQNDVEKTGGARDVMVRAMHNFLEDRFHEVSSSNIRVDKVNITAVSNTGEGFLQSRNRLVTFHVEGRDVDGGLLPDTSYKMDLRLLFFSQKEANGSTTLRVALDHYYIWVKVYSLNPLNLSPLRDIALEELKRLLQDVFGSPAKLIGLNIPSSVEVLSFKVLGDGGLVICLKPGGSTPLVRQLIEEELVAMATGNR